MNINFKTISILPLLLGLSMAGNIASADESAEGAARQKMTAEQKEALKQKWESMSPEEQAAYKARREERKEKWQNMTPEEQQAAREKLKESRR